MDVFQINLRLQTTLAKILFLDFFYIMSIYRKSKLFSIQSQQQSSRAVTSDLNKQRNSEKL